MSESRNKWLEDRLQWLDQQCRLRRDLLAKARAGVEEAEKALEAARSERAFEESMFRLWGEFEMRMIRECWDTDPEFMRSRHA